MRMVSRGSWFQLSSCYQCFVRIKKFIHIVGGVTWQGFKLSRAPVKHCHTLCLSAAFGSDVKLSSHE